MKSLRLVPLILCFGVFAISGCSSDETSDTSLSQEEAPTAEALPAIVQEAVTLARAIEANPDDPEAALRAHGTTVAEFDALMYDIAVDAKLSEAFERALQ